MKWEAFKPKVVAAAKQSLAFSTSSPAAQAPVPTIVYLWLTIFVCASGCAEAERIPVQPQMFQPQP